MWIDPTQLLATVAAGRSRCTDPRRTFVQGVLPFVDGMPGTEYLRWEAAGVDWKGPVSQSVVSCMHEPVHLVST